jgi:hypothetical protein
MNDDLNSSHSLIKKESYNQFNENNTKISPFRRIFISRNNTIKKLRKRSRKNSASISESSLNVCKKRTLKSTSDFKFLDFC